MHRRFNNTLKKFAWRDHLFLFKFILITIVTIGSNFLFVHGQTNDNYSETLLTLATQSIGSTELPAVIKGQTAYISVKALFDFLRIKSTPTSDQDSLTGFFMSPKATFVIDGINHSIQYEGKRFELSPDGIIKSSSDLYLKSDYFGKVFGLNCNFDFHSLSVVMTTQLELPMIRDLKHEQMYQNLSEQNSVSLPDTFFKRQFSLFNFGAADWMLIADQQSNGYKQARFYLGLGGMLLGGDATAYLNYNSGQPFLEKQQYYLWRYANNDNPFLRQTLAGKIFTQSISSIYDPVIGIQLTNTPTYFRRSFATYTLSDYTQPNWTVELYVNNVLVDYTKADASGFFIFNVPLVYGSTDIKLRYYGPWGEEKISKQSINVPFNFLPPNEFEYKISAGIVEDYAHSRFSQARLSYGISRGVTLTGGVEYLSSISRPQMPYLSATLRLPSNFIFTSEYVYQVRTRQLLSYHSPFNLQLDLSYVKYQTDQDAVKFNYTQEARAMVSMPFHIGKFSSFSRLTVDHNMVLQNKNTNMELLISGGIRWVNFNVTTYAFALDHLSANTYSNISTAFALPAGTIITPKVQYQYNSGKFLNLSILFEKKLSKHGYVDFSYEDNLISNRNIYQLGFRYDLSAAHLGFLATHSGNESTITESASGSILYERKADYFSSTAISNMGRGGIIIIPFLDINNNGIHDKDEPKVSGLNIQATGGSVKKSKNDTSIIISGLEPYTDCLVNLNTSGIENIAWVIDKKTLSIEVTPNQFRVVEIPVKVIGEVSGTIRPVRSDGQENVNGLKINFYTADSIFIASTISQSDGEFSYLGLPSGSYTAAVDASQLATMHLSAKPVHFVIQNKTEGDVIYDLEITLQELGDR